MLQNQRDRVGAINTAGFTLVELMIVVAILATAASLLMPAVSQARSTAKSVTCLSNLRQMGIALQMYVIDHRQTYPQPFVEVDLGSAGENCLWFNAIDRYTGLPVKRYTSASDRNYSYFKQDPVWATFGETTASTGGNGSRTIKMNIDFGAIGSGVKWGRLGKIIDPIRTVVLFDAISPDVGFSTSDSSRFHGSESHAALRHSRFRSANVLFVDGHASEIQQTRRQHYLYNVLFQTWYDEPSSLQTLKWTIPK